MVIINIVAGIFPVDFCNCGFPVSTLNLYIGHIISVILPGIVFKLKLKKHRVKDIAISIRYIVSSYIVEVFIYPV